MNLSLIIIITLLPAIAWFFLWRAQDKEKEPYKAMIWCFALGILASVPFFLIKTFFPELVEIMNDYLELYLFAFLEEILKALILVLAIEISRKWFSQVVDGLIYGSAVALGFAFAENVFYLSGFLTLDFSFVMVYLVRSINTMVAHTMFTGLFGFFYASAYLREEIFHLGKRVKPWSNFWNHFWQSLYFHVTIFHILPNRPSDKGHYPGSLILEGILVVSLAHVLFNYLLQKQINGINIGFLTFPLVFALGYLCWRLFLQGIYTRIVHKIKA